MSEVGRQITQEKLKKESADLIQRYGELTIDSFLDDGILKDIPFLKTLVGAWKSGIAIKDAIFFKKVARFFQEPANIPTKKRQKLLAKLENDPEYATRFTSHLVLILEAVDDLEKPAIIARLFEAYVLEWIDLADFRRLCRAVNNIAIDDLLMFLDHFNFDQPGPHGVPGMWPVDRRPINFNSLKANETDLLHRLFPSGLVSLEEKLIGEATLDAFGEEGYNWVEVGTRMKASMLGYKYASIMMDAFVRDKN